MADYTLPLCRLQEIGKEITDQGYSFPRLYGSATLFWNMLFQEKLSFSRENIVLVDGYALHKIYRRCAKRKIIPTEQETVYPYLSKSIRRRYSLEDVVAAYNDSGEAYLFGKLGIRRLLGLYEPEKNCCYLKKSLCPQNKVSVGMHELAHRQVARRKRLEKANPFPIGEEEEFCRDLENAFWSILFSDSEPEEETAGFHYLQQAYLRISSREGVEKSLKRRARWYDRLLSVSKRDRCLI